MNDDRYNKIDNYNSRQLARQESQLPSEIYYSEDINLVEGNQIRDYLDIILRRKWLIILSLAILLVTSAISTLLQTPLYKATAVIEITPETQKITSFQKELEFGLQTWDLREFYETHYRLIKSKSLAKSVIERLNLSSKEVEPKQDNDAKVNFLSFIKQTVSEIVLGKKETPKKNNFDPRKDAIEKRELENSLASAFSGGIIVTPDRKSRLANISYVDADSAYAANAVNTLVDEYVKWTIRRRHDSTKAAREFLSEQLKSAKANLERSEEELTKFAKSVDVVSLDKDLNLVYKQLAQLNEAYAKSETERISKQALYQQSLNGNFEYFPQAVEDEYFQDLNVKYAEVKSEYNNKSTIYGPNYPEIKQLRAQMGAIESEISKKKRQIGRSIKTDYEAALKKEEKLKSRTEEQNKRAALLNEKAIQYNILEREVDSNKSIYESLLQRLKETEITSAVETTNVHIVDYASIPISPFQPNLQSNLLKAGFLGLLIGLLLAFLIEHFDNAIRDDDEIKNKFPMPFLGSIPLSELEKNQPELEKISYVNPRSIISEAFRVVRTSIMYSFPDSPPKSLLVTSSQPLEGKTTSASNLALSMTQSGNSVVLVDADLRKPRVHKIYLNGTRNGHGLSNYLIGQSDLEKIIHETKYKNLSIIPAGSIPPNPAELLGSKKMLSLINDLIEKYDYVILDGAPVSGFADSRLLSRLVDGVLLVTSIGITQRSTLRNVIEDITSVGGRIVGTIVNRISSKRGKYGYNYYYYYTDETGNETKKIPKTRTHNS